MVNNSIPRRFAAEKMDKTLYYVRMKHDSQIHCIVKFNGFVDENLMSRAIRLSMDAEPILGCRFVLGRYQPFWSRREDLDRIGVCHVQRTFSLDAEINAFLTKPIDPFNDPLIQAIIFRGQHDTIVVKVNHMVADGGGVKEYIYLLAEIYNALMDSPDFIPFPNIHGCRSFHQVRKFFKPADKLKMVQRGLLNWMSDIYPPNGWTFPFDPSDNMGKSFISRHFGPKHFHTIKNYCDRFHVTINDVFIALIFRSLSKIIRPARYIPKRLVTTVDLRRYTASQKAEAICNLAGAFQLNIGDSAGTDLNNAINRIHRKMLLHKKNSFGLGDYYYTALNLNRIPFTWSQ